MTSRPGRAATVARTVARVGHAHWLFGNLYEEVVRMPDRLADQHALPRSARHRTPVPYYLPAAPVTLAATVTTALLSRDRTVTAAAACTGTGMALTGWVVATVIRRLVDDGPPLSAAERSRLVRRWHRVNRVRLVLAAAAAVGLERGA